MICLVAQGNRILITYDIFVIYAPYRFLEISQLFNFTKDTVIY